MTDDKVTGADQCELIRNVSPDDLKINKKFSHMLPPLSDETIEGLKSKMIVEGTPGQSVHVDHNWNLLDGLHRRKLATELGMNLDVIVHHDITTEAQAMKWVFKNQDFRRNWDSRLQRQQFIGLMLRAQNEPPQTGQSRKGRKDDRIAEHLGLSRSTVKRDKAKIDRDMMVDEAKEQFPNCTEVITAIADPDQKITKKEFAKLCECGDIGTVNRVIARDHVGLRDAYKKVMATPLSKPGIKVIRPRDEPEEADAPAEMTQKEIFEDFCLKMKGCQKTVDSIIKVIDHFSANVEPMKSNDQALAKTITSAFSVATVAIEKWNQKYLGLVKRMK